MQLIRCNSSDQRFIELVKQLDAELAIRDGDDHAFYDQFNKIDDINYVVLLVDGDELIGCGAIKPFDKDCVEVKRMFTVPAHRGKGDAARILAELEYWAAELGYNMCILETGFKQPEAISLYRKCGYVQTPNYGQYAGIDNSICFRKKIAGLRSGNIRLSSDTAH